MIHPLCFARSTFFPSKTRARAHRMVAALLLLVAWFALERTAVADEALAREHFRKGVALYDKKAYQPALDEFEIAYREKPSPGIKQNIALCLKGLQKPVQAATAFDEALAEGKDTLKPDTRAAIEQELAELSKIVATIRLDVVTVGDRKPVADAEISMGPDGSALSPIADWHRPIRVTPGIYVFRAHVPGYAEPPEKKLSLLAGSPVDAAFEVTKSGAVTLRSDVPSTVIRVDGTEVGRGTWSGTLVAGPHKAEFAASGYPTTIVPIVVIAGASVDYPVVMARPADLPPYYYAAPTQPPPVSLKKHYFVGMFSVDTETLRLSSALGELPEGRRRTFTGGSFGVRAGLRLSRFFAAELYADVGLATAKYQLPASNNNGESLVAQESETRLSQFQVTPLLRFSTAGKVRFTTATGVGVHGNSISASLVQTFPSRVDKDGSSLTASWLMDAGIQFDLGSIFLEGAGFVDVNGIGSVRDSEGHRLLLDSPAARLGARFGLGFSF
ncbi:hypothetical protein AKJ09_05336 [Labilithrix luteola]|uniref:PEGA domain-containing protein n=1 Tax=Labilithrix luteola TaxID=1391654 RepID=A0A0K1PYU9_9BACT|nr:hypothetical protein [Labilithrix luteola]AKU98672.1 hypothetical protein AKJ09_05336 [Labilithrix luteola]